MAARKPITQYRRDHRRAAEARAALEATRQQIIEQGCPHPDEFVHPWHTTIYQVGSFVEIGKQCSICDAKLPKFDEKSGWVEEAAAAKGNLDACPHPAEWHQDWSWHHGYGKYVTGVVCGYCGAWKSFKSQGYWSSRDVERRSHRDDD